MAFRELYLISTELLMRRCDFISCLSVLLPVLASCSHPQTFGAGTVAESEDDNTTDGQRQLVFKVEGFT
ncbi:hypothetical protein RAS2_18710 [Phycisphaerae bacterium RAS2]|nr:hypothetical protein RAS2_18710 [Phycisphaerae bacterium RAS2]